MKWKFVYIFLLIFLIGCNNKTTGDLTTENIITLPTTIPSTNTITTEIANLEIEFRVSEGMLQWKYETSSLWNDIYSLDNFNGLGIEAVVINEDGELVITYTDSTFSNLGKFNQLHLVQFLDGQGRVLSVQLVKDGEPALEPIIPDLVGHYFGGWSEDFAEVFDDLVIVPYFFASHYTIYLNENGGSEVGNYGYDYGIPIQLPIPERPGYVFLGWYLGLDANSQKIEDGFVLTSDVFAYAHWQKVNSINVKTEEEFLNALSNESYPAIYFDNDIEVYDTIRLTRNVEIYGNGYNLISKTTEELFIFEAINGNSAPYVFPNNGKLVMNDVDIIVDHGINNFAARSIFSIYHIDNFELLLNNVDILGSVNRGISIEESDFAKVRYLNGNLDVNYRCIEILMSYKFDILIDNSSLTSEFPLYVGASGNSVLRIESTDIISKEVDELNSGLTISSEGNNDFTIRNTNFYSLNSLNTSYAITVRDSDGGQRIELESVKINSKGNTLSKIINDEYFNTSLMAEEVTLILDEGITELPDYAFYNNQVFSHIVLPASLKTIGHQAFSFSNYLQSLVIPDGVEWIGDGAFSNDDHLCSVVIPNTVTYLGGEAFNGTNSNLSIYLAGGMDTSAWDSNWNDSLGTVFPNIQGVKTIDGVTYVALMNDDVKIIDYIYSGEPHIVIPDEIEFDSELFEVREIGDCAFYINNSLKSIEIPATVFGIGEGAFMQNTALESVVFRENSELWIIDRLAFSYCINLKSIFLPDSLEYLMNEAFSFNYRLEVVDFGDNPQIEIINDYTFYQNSNLLTIIIPNTVNEIGYMALSNCIRLKNIDITEDSQLVKIADYAFYNNLSLEEFYLPSSVTEIGNYAFAQNINLANFVIGEGSILQKVKSFAFYNNISLISIDLPDSVDTLGPSAFQYCESLTYFLMPLGVTIIEVGLFYDCDSLEVVEFKEDSQITEIRSWAFAYNDSLFALNLPDTLTIIGSYSFYFAESLEIIYIPDSVITIDSYAFSNCINLMEVVIEFNTLLTNINSYAFENCTSLNEILIFETVTYIGSFAFYNCYDLSIKVFADIEPVTWDSSWNDNGGTVTWGYVNI